jgi:DHA1 family bicyclomycin/chloramphenicol resistance-like MFS transporter
VTVTTPERVRPGRVLALGGLSSFGPLALDFYLPGLPMLAADLGTTEAAAQLSLSLCMIGLALGQLVFGPLTDRVGRRRVLVSGVALFVVTTVLCALAPSIELLLGLRLLAGLGGGAGIVIARSMARDLYHGPALGRVYARLMLVSGVTPVLGPVFGGQLLLVTDWRGTFVALAAIGLLLLVTALAQRETLPTERRRASGARDTARVLGGLLRERTFLPPTVVLGLGLAAMFAYLAMGSFVLQDVYGLSPQSFAAVSGTNALGILLCSQASAALVRRVGAAALLAVGVRLALGAAIAMLVGVLVSDSAPALLVPLFVLVSCTGLISPNATALALERHGELAGSASALLGVAQFGVAAIVPPLASLGGVSPTVLATTAVATAGATAVAHLFVLRVRQASPIGEADALANLRPTRFQREASPYAPTDPLGHDVRSPAPDDWDRRLDSRVDEAAGGRAWHRAVDLRPAHRPDQRDRLHWVEVDRPDPALDPAPDDAESRRRREWERIAALARQARLAADTERFGPAHPDEPDEPDDRR